MEAPIMKKEDIKKVVLAYSGGLDTSIIIPWLKENYNNCEVIAVSGNVGQADELDGLEEKAIKTGASKLYVLDLTDEYVDDYIIPTMQAGAAYEEYLLGTSHARPCIAKGLVEIAQKEGADAIAHGCTGKGNDQVRFELAIKHFAPDMPIIAPWREWDIKSREEEIAYAEAHNVPLKINRETNYSKDKNPVFRLHFNRFRVVAPRASHVTALQKHRGANPRAVVHRHALNIGHNSLYFPHTFTSCF